MRPRSWLLLKGIKQDARHWRGVPAALAARLGVPVHTADLPGVGRLVDEPAQIGIGALLRVVQRQAVGMPRPIGLCGLSLGGMVVLRWAQQAPHEIAVVVVGNTSAGDLSNPWERMTPRALGGIAAAALTRDPVRRERKAVDLISEACDDAERARLAREHASWQAAAGIRPATLLRQVLAGATFRLNGSVSRPVVVLVGARDRFVDPACSYALAASLGVTPQVHPDAGHDLTIDAPDWLLDELVRAHG